MLLSYCLSSELELELIQTQMTQKPMLRVEVGARALRNQTGGVRGGSEFSDLWVRKEFDYGSWMITGVGHVLRDTLQRLSLSWSEPQKPAAPPVKKRSRISARGV